MFFIFLFLRIGRIKHILKKKKKPSTLIRVIRKNKNPPREREREKESTHSFSFF